MKVLVTESQLKVLLKEDRVTYLRNNNVVNPDILNEPIIPNTADMSDEEAAKVRKKLERKKVKVTPIEGHDGVDVGYIIEKKGKLQIRVTEEIFNNIVAADPSANKQYVEWMLIVFAKHIKDGDINQAVRFVTEDLPEANEFLKVFDFWKSKKNKFAAAKNRPNAPDNPSDIRQYNDLAHLYSVISPFIGMSQDDDDDEEDDGVSKLYKKMKGYIDLGQANVVYHDSDVLVYVPNHIDASCGPLGSLASWCTRREGNSYFDSYRKNNPKPDGSLSDYYVIMPKELFDMENPAEHDKFPYQFHFESNQIHDKSNRGIGDEGVVSLLSKYPGLGNFLKGELGTLAADSIRSGTGLMDNKYISYLNRFGGKTSDFVPEEAYAEGVVSIKKLAKENRGPINNNKYLKWLMSNEDNIEIIDYIPLDIDNLNFDGINIEKLPDLSMFTDCDQVSATKCNIKESPKGSELPPNMTILTLHDNQITKATFDGYSDKLQTLFVVNIFNNPLVSIDVENLKKLFDNETLARFAISNPENLQNYDDYAAMVSNFERTHPNSGIYADT
tara:strand:- start:3438 stop:5105 length:1668 start_codon:yes stop_codon:yes gene_type:complete